MADDRDITAKDAKSAIAIRLLREFDLIDTQVISEYPPISQRLKDQRESPDTKSADGD